jgi:hypothetical protein
MTTAEACALVVELTYQVCATRLERDQAVLVTRGAVRAAARLSADLDRLRYELRREQEQHAALREELLLSAATSDAA